MSRCFPFPPPGFVKTTRAETEGLDLLLEKDKHKEKKHKKDKKDKEKREGKEKEDKERKDKEKHKDKKDRKEKHKDKKRDKNKDKSRQSEDGPERQVNAYHEQTFGESSRKSEEIKDSEFKEELARRIQEKGAANRPVENFTSSTQHSHEDFSAVPKMENERIAFNKMHVNSVGTTRRKDGLGQQTNNIVQHRNGTAIRHGENSISSAAPSRDKEQINNIIKHKNGTAIRRGENFSSSAVSAMDKERVRVSKGLPDSADFKPAKEGTGQRINILVPKRAESPSSEAAKEEIVTGAQFLPNSVNTMQKVNGKVGWPVENARTSVQRFDNASTSSVAAAAAERGMRPTIPSPSITIRRPNGIVRPTESFSMSTQKKPDAGGLGPSMGKQKDQAVLPNNIATEHNQINSKRSSVEKVADGRTERLEKVKDGATDDAKREKDKRSGRHEKKKGKDKHKEKKKEKEVIKEKEEQNYREHDKLRENSINYQIDGLHMKPLAPPSDDAKAAPADENVKKRKNHEMNGCLQNHDMRPTKLSRMTLSNTPVENGTASHVAAPLSSTKPVGLNIVKAERLPDKKEEKINGNTEAQLSSADSRLRNPIADIENGTSAGKSPHRDSKYLNQIYAVPEMHGMTEWHEPDDQDWLLEQGRNQSKKRKLDPEADGAPHVWAQALKLKVDSADVIALPYVIPF